MVEYFLIAEIKNVADNKAYLSLKSYSDFPERFYELNEVFIDVFGEKRKFVVDDVKYINNQFMIKLKNFDISDDVKFLIQKKIFVDGKKAVVTEKDTFFIHDIIGNKVIKNSQYFGKVIDMLKIPGNDVFVIQTKDNKELLIPVAKEFIVKIDKNRKELFLSPNYDYDEN